MPAVNGRLDELLLIGATQALSEAERTELEGLLAAQGSETADIYERAAAAVHVGTLRRPAPMPGALRARIERQALRYLETREGSDPQQNPRP